MLTFDGVFFSYPSKEILKKCSYSFQKGCYVIFGENGCGKSTFLKLGGGLLFPQKGEIRIGNVLSKDKKYGKSLISYIPDEPWLHPYMSVEDTFLFFEDMWKKQVLQEDWDFVLESLEAFGLQKWWKYSVKALSRGNKQKLSWLLGLMKPSQVICVDEPVVGLDEFSLGVILSLIKKVSQKKTILIASHHKSYFEGAHMIDFNDIFLTKGL